MEKYSDRAREWVNQIYRPVDAELADKVIGEYTSVSEQCLKLLSCFPGIRSLDDVFSIYDEEYHGEMDETDRFYEIWDLGFYDVKEKPVTAQWFLLPFPMPHFGVDICAYFPSFRRAVEFTAQMALHQHVKGVLEYGDTASDWKSIFERQLARAWVAVRWHELGGELQPAVLSVMDCFPNLEISGLQLFDDFALNTLLAPSGDHSLRDEYQQFFRQAPDADSLKRFECWEWINRRLPDEF